MLMDDFVEADVYQLHLWAGTQLLWSGSFKPSSHGEGHGMGFPDPQPRLGSGGGGGGRRQAGEGGASSLLRVPRRDGIFAPFWAPASRL